MTASLALGMMRIIAAQQDIDAGRQGKDGHCKVLDVEIEA
jgi:hypothetical protein